jgi:mannan endo-1,4-beta-mannosidase
MKLQKTFGLIALCCLLLAGCSEKLIGFKPVNPKATPEAKQLLSFLYSIQGKYTLTGQHNFASDLPRYDNIVYQMTGKYPAVWGADFSFMAQGDSVRKFQHCGPMNLTTPFDSCALNGQTKEELRQGIIDEAKKRYASGRIITLMWHCCFPLNGDECDGADIWRLTERLPSQEEWDELVTDGTNLNTLWKKQMDGIAVYLKQLRDANIPVLWRPFHEMNGVWFWWCNKPGENGFKKLYIAMYEYFTKHHELNNLLWVWDTNAPRNRPGDEAGPYPDYFPGLEYVDVLAADVYGDWKQSHHDDLKALAAGKPIALGEVGNVPADEIYQNQPDWVWYMVWGYGIYDFRSMLNREPGAPPANPAVVANYSNPKSITLDKIDFSDKTYKLKKES